MNTGTTMLQDATMSIGEAKSRYGSREPQIEVRIPKGTAARRLHAALHRLAAEIELATPENESWLVHAVPLSDNRGRVYIELSNGDDAEAKRAAAVLRTITL